MKVVQNITMNSGIGFTGLLTILFIALKLCNVITWSWLWVLSPIWISFGLGLGTLILFIILWLIVYMFSMGK